MNSESLGENVEFWDVWALRGYDDGMLNENYQSMSRRIAADVGPVDYALDVATGTGLAAFELAKNVG
jgi:ubiquinone/menaquinone biosynthesis C-methylase UbiE